MAGEPTGGGRGRNRGSRKRNNKRNKQQGPKKPNVPPPPQTKLIWRTIGNTEKYGTVEQILGMIQKVLDICNQKNASYYTIEIDRSAVRSLIQEEELAQKYLSKLQAEKAEQEEKAEDYEQDQQGDENDNEEKTMDVPEKKEMTPKEVPQPDSSLDVVVAPKLSSSVPVITARPLYAIPPKTSRRRGERGGCAYLLLTAPKIEKIEIPETPQEAKEQEVQEMQDQSAETAVPKSPPPTQDEDLPSEEAATVVPAETPPTLVPEAEAAARTDSGSAETATPAVPSKALPTVDYSSAVAKGRLLLSRAIESLSEVTQEDAKGAQEYAGCLIEPAMSGKTWRPHYRADRREGTIEGTADYKNWLKSLTTKKEELSSRPKPTPGGGAANSLIGLTDAANDAEQPVATIVQHLRAKREDLKRKKARTKKDKNDKAKTNKKKTVGGAARGGMGAPSAATGKKKKKKAAKKKGPGGARNAGAVAPTLLKPPSS